MSHTIAQRHGTHVRVPWTAVITVIAAAAAAAMILVLVNRPPTTTTGGGEAVVSVAVEGAAAVPMQDTVAQRRLAIEQAELRARASDVTVAKQLADRAYVGGPPSPQRAIAIEADVVSPASAEATLAKQLADRAFFGGAATAASDVAAPSLSTRVKLGTDRAFFGE
jgi:hypothetical protein